MLLALCWACGCDVYRQGSGSRVDPVLDGGPVVMPAPSDNTPDGGVATGMPPEQCASGRCWWSVMQEGCQTAGWPTPEQRPTTDALDETAANKQDIYLGWTKLHVGASDPQAGAMPVDSAWQSIGLNVDGICTNSITCPAAQNTSCKSLAPQIPFDGELCRDNSFARILAVAAQVPEVGPRFGLFENAFNCGLRRGTYNIITRIRDYNGLSDDSNVRVDWYMSDGLETPPGWDCTEANAYAGYPRWRTSATWRIDPAGLTERPTIAGVLPDSKLVDTNAYVRGGYLVSEFPDGSLLRLAGDGRPFRGLDLTVRKAVWVGRIARGQDNTWEMQDGLVAGRMQVEDVMQTFRRSGFCRSGGLETFYQSITAYVHESADVLASGANDAEVACDALSFGIGFDAAQVTPGSMADVPPPIECCAPGRTHEDCQVQCGDGKVSGDEACDTAIAEGSPGACPTRCETSAKCKQAVLNGTGCAARCVEEDVVALKAGDGCCPPGGDSAKDPDCPSSCGNGALEPGETCDPPSMCSACEAGDPCLLGNLSGSPEECNAQCRWSVIAECGVGDKCCPSGCASGNDVDCSPSCGDGRIEPERGETCEAGSATPCPTTCDDGIGCTLDFTTGSAANCNVRCSHIEIVRSISGDRCCPQGANTLADSDCTPVCGNGVVEAGETCDDGERVDGDGCSQNCQAVSDIDVCLESVGEFPDACAACVCEQCAPEAKSCFGAATPAEVKLCADIVRCAGEAACDGVECYCGADLLRCSIGLPNGPCRMQIEAAAGSDALDVISSRTLNPMYPIGRANAVGSCTWNRCAEPCGFTQGR